MEIIKTNNERLLTIINDVLDLSKIESGIMKLEIKTVDIEKIFSETYSDFSRQLTNSNVKLYYDSDNVSCIIDTDRTRFTQVLINFMTKRRQIHPHGVHPHGVQLRGNGRYSNLCSGFRSGHSE
jgi:signal transduction histidine kinase